LQVGIDVAKPIAKGVLKIKDKLGELMPATKGGRGKKTPVGSTGVFSEHTIAAYRKIHRYQIDWNTFGPTGTAQNEPRRLEPGLVQRPGSLPRVTSEHY
jgi:hypothetical protein